MIQVKRRAKFFIKYYKKNFLREKPLFRMGGADKPP